MRTLHTMCPMNCHPTYCGMMASIDDQGRVDITADAQHPESRGFLCKRGRQVQAIVDHSNRLLTPLVRTERQEPWRPDSWDNVLSLLADRLSRPDRVAVWLGHGAVVSDLNRPLLFHFAHAIGAYIWNPAVVCWTAGAYGLAATGIVETNTKEDMAQNSDFLLLWGWNVASQPTSAPALLEAKKRGARIVAIDCRRAEAARLADEAWLIRPDSDAALALAIAHELIRTDRIHHDFIAAYTVGFPAFAAAVLPYTPEWAEERTDLPAHVIRQLASAYADASAAMILLGASSMFKGEDGWLASRAIACLPALTGSVGRPGAGFGPRHRGFVQALDYAPFPSSAPPSHAVPSHMEKMLETLESGQIDTLMLFGTNFASSFADANRVEAALQRVPLVVAHDIVMNRTMDAHANIALPGTVWIEELGLKATDTHVYLMDQVREPIGDARSIANIVQELAGRMNRPDANPGTQEELLNSMLTPFGEEGTIDAMRKKEGRLSRRARFVGHADLRFHTPSGKIEFFSERLAQLGLPPLPQPQSLSPHRSAASQQTPYPLSLRTGRSAQAFHSFYDEGRMLEAIFAEEPLPVVWIHPSDATLRGIDHRASIVLFNDRSELGATARVTTDILPGVLWLRDGWFGLNHLTEGRSPLPSSAAEGLLPISMAGGKRSIPGGQSSYVAYVDVRASKPCR